MAPWCRASRRKQASVSQGKPAGGVNRWKVNDYIGMAEWDDKPRAGRRCWASFGLYKIARSSQHRQKYPTIAENI